MKFKTGEIYMTSGISFKCNEDEKFKTELVSILVKRYFKCDWGELDKFDKTLNDLAVENNNDRILAKYSTLYGYIYIITEWDRSGTTIMFCNEY